MNYSLLIIIIYKGFGMNFVLLLFVYCCLLLCRSELSHWTLENGRSLQYLLLREAGVSVQKKGTLELIGKHLASKTVSIFTYEITIKTQSKKSVYYSKNC